MLPPAGRRTSGSPETRASDPRAAESPAVEAHETERIAESDAPARKERILGVAERLFRHYGPAKTTVADIARACGIGVGSVYLDFASKEEILEALAAQRNDEIVERMTAAAREVEDPRERVARMLEARTLAFLELAERGVHACDLVRCADSILAGRRAGKVAPPQPGPGGAGLGGAGSGGAGSGGAVPTGFGARARGLLRVELLRAHGHDAAEVGASTSDPEVDAAVEAIELAFVALSPPNVTRLARDRALALSRALARLVVFGV